MQWSLTERALVFVCSSARELRAVEKNEIELTRRRTRFDDQYYSSCEYDSQ
jgi:hypothetical protein